MTCDEPEPPHQPQIIMSVPSNIPLTKSLAPPIIVISSSSQTVNSQSQIKTATPNVIRVTTTSSYPSAPTSKTQLIGSHHPKSLTPTRLFTPLVLVPVTTPKPIATSTVFAGVLNKFLGFASKAYEALIPNKSSSNPVSTSGMRRNVPEATVQTSALTTATFVTPPTQSVNETTSQSTIGTSAQPSHAVSNPAPNPAPMFKVFVHDVVSSPDAERITHLCDALTPTIRKDIFGILLNPGLYQHALSELHKRYGNAKIVSQACTSSLLKLQPFRDNDYKSLRAF
ncbi:hypothetical protein OUZ56_010073 [Daphnia magna]|uniref:Uncharacterized protein n=1 Tax=Daphnia magna TaxID=35525 RepID=A0ABR0AHQ6_9CRUS|nr:hypothetical protein OUZ56_010073 [Daphnia magna]